MIIFARLVNDSNDCSRRHVMLTDHALCNSYASFMQPASKRSTFLVGCHGCSIKVSKVAIVEKALFTRQFSSPLLQFVFKTVHFYSEIVISQSISFCLSLTLPMLRPLSSKAQRYKKFENPLNPVMLVFIG